MQRSANDLEKWVLRRLDEVTPPGSEPAVPAGAERDELLEAAKDVANDAPIPLLYAMCKAATPDVEAVTDADGNVCYAEADLPADFLRLVRVQLNGWTVPIIEDRLQSSELPNYRALLAGDVEPTPRRPAAVLCPAPLAESGQKLQLWPPGDAPALRELVYLPVPEPTDIPETLVDAIVWAGAQRVANTHLREYDVGGVCFKYFKEAISRAWKKSERLADRNETKSTTQLHPSY